MNVKFVLGYFGSSDDINTLSERETLGEVVRDMGNDMIMHRDRTVDRYVIQEYLTDENGLTQDGRTLELHPKVYAPANAEQSE